MLGLSIGNQFKTVLEATIAFNLASGTDLSTFFHHGILRLVSQSNKRSNNGQGKNGEHRGNTGHSKTSSAKGTNRLINSGHASMPWQFAFLKPSNLL